MPFNSQHRMTCITPSMTASLRVTIDRAGEAQRPVTGRTRQFAPHLHRRCRGFQHQGRSADRRRIESVRLGGRPGRASRYRNARTPRPFRSTARPRSMPSLLPGPGRRSPERCCVGRRSGTGPCLRSSLRHASATVGFIHGRLRIAAPWGGGKDLGPTGRARESTATDGHTAALNASESQADRSHRSSVSTSTPFDPWFEAAPGCLSRAAAPGDARL